MSFSIPIDNLVALQLAAPYLAGSGQFQLKSGQGALFTVFPTIVTLIQYATYNTGAQEIKVEYTVTGKTGDLLTGATVVSGYTDQAFSVNDYVEGRVSALYLTQVQNALSTSIATVNTEATLPSARKLVAGTNVTLTDGGAGSTLTIAATGGGSSGLTIQSVQSSSFTASVGNFYPVDLSGGSLTVTLPTAPTTGSQVGLKIIKESGTNTLTVNCGGSDAFDVAGGATTGSLKILNQGAIIQYFSGPALWYGFSTNLPLSGLDSRYVVGSSGNIMTNSAGLMTAATNFTMDTTNNCPQWTAIADPTTPAAGDMWFSSGSNSFAQCRVIDGSSNKFNVRADGTFFSCGSCTALASFTSSASLFGSPTSVLGSLTIPANTLKVGQVIELWAYGTWGCTASSPTFGFSILAGGTTLGSFPTGLLYNAAVTNLYWGAGYGPVWTGVVTAIGSSGGILGNGLFEAIKNIASFGTTAIYLYGSNATPITINTSTAFALDFQCSCSASNASNTIQILGAQWRIRG
jgi:hypothetical protein